MRTSKARVSACVLFSLAGVARAQTYEDNAARLRFQVYNPATNLWGTSVSVPPIPGTRVEWRVLVDYIGTRTDLFALGSLPYQPSLANADNDGAFVDQLGPWSSTYLSAAEGDQGTPLPAYGRVQIGSRIGVVKPYTTLRHGAGSDGAPPGEWIRVAQPSATSWPAPGIPTSGGVLAQQTSQALGSTFHVAGVANIVIFRQSLIIGDLSERAVTIGAIPDSIGIPGPGGDQRYMSWQTGPSDPGTGTLGHRTGVVISPAVVCIVCLPTPGPVVPLLAGVVFVSRRRRMQTSTAKSCVH